MHKGMHDAMHDDELRVAARFCGPPRSGNGGYVSGLLAHYLGPGPVEVTLRSPPPLERMLRVEVERVAGSEHARLFDASLLIAEARSSQLVLDVPAPPSFAQAEEWSHGYPGLTSHAFPGCFTCGPARAVGDGLRIFAGPSPDRSLLAATWLPDASLADSDGAISTAVAWAALDCPGYFAAAHPAFALLGRICAEVPLQLTATTRYIVMGWSLGAEGRKFHAGTAIFDEAGVLHGRAKQTWIAR